MSAPQSGRSQFFVVLVRAIYGSKVTQVLAATIVAALTVTLAAWCWRRHGVKFFAIWFLFWGFSFARRLWPVSERTRARWAYQRSLAKRYDSYRMRRAVWVGVGLFLYVFWGLFTGKQVDGWDFTFAGIFVVWGALAHWYWKTVHADQIEQRA